MIYLLYTGLIIWGVTTWRNYKDKRFFWYLIPISGLLILTVFEDLSSIFLPLTAAQRTIESHVLIMLRVVAIVALTVLAFKKPFK